MKKFAAVLLIACGLSLPVLAQTTFWYMSSIAYDETTGIAGWATGFLYQQDAVQAAKQACRNRGGVNCKVAIPAFDSCGALSTGANGEGYWGIGKTKDLAHSRAMNACEKDANHGCKVLVSLCSESGTLPPLQLSPIGPRPTPSTPSQPKPTIIPCPPGTQHGLGGCYGY
jgi:Domain of unknown function (DUF4189)